MLQSVFGDDEHTSTEGPYRRLMRSRKWLVISASLAVLLDHGLYKEGAVLDIIKIFSLPEYLLKQAIIFGLVYILFQYSILVLQLLSVYDLELSERFSFRKIEKLESLQSKIHERGEKIKSLGVKLRDTESNLLEGTPISVYNRAKSELPSINEEIESVQQEVHFLRMEQTAIAKSDPASRLAYKAAEVSIDIARLGPAGAFGWISLAQLIHK